MYKMWEMNDEKRQEISVKLLSKFFKVESHFKK